MTCMTQKLIFNTWKVRDICIICKTYWWFMHVISGGVYDWNSWLLKFIFNKWRMRETCIPCKIYWGFVHVASVIVCDWNKVMFNS